MLSVSQDFADDATGKLIEGFFECFDQYESELNGLRTSAAMRESVRQGFYPGAHAPYGFRTVPVEFHPGVLRHRLVIEPREAAVLQQAYRLDISSAGAKSVARELNRLGHRTRSGALWTKGLVGNLLEHEAAVGTVWWGRRQGNRLRPKEEWLALKVEPIIDDKTYALAQQLRRQREPRRAPGRAAAKPHVLSGLLRCGTCGSSYQLETSGKKVDGTVYRYCYYNCRAACRTGVEACAGFRVSTEVLDGAVLSAIADVVCTEERARHLARSHGWPAERVLPAWRALITADCDIGRGYALHLIERIDVFGEHLVVTPKDGGRIAKAPEIGLLTDL